MLRASAKKLKQLENVVYETIYLHVTDLDGF